MPRSLRRSPSAAYCQEASFLPRHFALLPLAHQSNRAVLAPAGAPFLKANARPMKRQSPAVSERLPAGVPLLI